MATPRSQGLFAEARALVDAASVAGDSDLRERAQALYSTVTDYLASPWPTWMRSDPQHDVDAMGREIETRTGVNPLDLDTAANLQSNSGDKTVDALLGGGGWGAVAADKASDAASAVGTGLKWTFGSLFVALVLLGALFIYVNRVRR